VYENALLFSLGYRLRWQHFLTDRCSNDSAEIEDMKQLTQ